MFFFPKKDAVIKLIFGSMIDFSIAGGILSKHICIFNELTGPKKKAQIRWPALTKIEF